MALILVASILDTSQPYELGNTRYTGKIFVISLSLPPLRVSYHKFISTNYLP